MKDKIEDLNDLRCHIDTIDEKLVKLFEDRMETVVKVAQYKKENNIEILNSSREEEVIKKSITYLKNKRFEDETKEFFEFLMDVSKRYQSKILK